MYLHDVVESRYYGTITKARTAVRIDFVKREMARQFADTLSATMPPSF